MSEETETFDAFNSLIDELRSVIKNVENPLDIIEVGATEFVKDLGKLARPYSKIRKSGYTHLVDTFNCKRGKDEIEVGWGKYYGPIVENGSLLAAPQPHLVPTFEKNKDKYYEKMINEIFK